MFGLDRFDMGPALKYIKGPAQDERTKEQQKTIKKAREHAPRKMKAPTKPPPLRPLPRLTWPPPEEMVMPGKLEQMEPEWVWLDREDRTKITPNKFIVLWGPRGGGKTFAMDALLYSGRKYFSRGIVMTETSFNEFWQKRFPPKAIFDQFDPVMLDAFVDQKKKFMKKWNRSQEMQKTVNPYDVIVLEDCIAADKIHHVEALKKLAANGRHIRTTVIITSQHARGLGPLIRDNVDWSFIFYETSFDQKDALARTYLSQLMEGENYRDKDVRRFITKHTTINEETKERDIIAVMNERRTNEMDKKLFNAKFQEPPDYWVGTTDFWMECS
jgi:hypothetical protein